MNRYEARRWLAYVFLASITGVALSGALTRVFSPGYDAMSTSSGALMAAMVCLIAGLQLVPERARFSLMPAIGICTGTTIVQLQTGSLLAGPRELAFISALMLLAATVTFCQRRLAVVMRSHRSATAAMQVIFLTLSLAPIWLGPVAALNSQKQIIVDAIVAVSPISYLASVIGADYLRGDWFYQYVEIGLQRFNYPQPGLVTLILFAITLLAWSPVSLTNLINPSQQKFSFIGVNNNHE